MGGEGGGRDSRGRREISRCALVRGMENWGRNKRPAGGGEGGRVADGSESVGRVRSRYGSRGLRKSPETAETGVRGVKGAYARTSWRASATLPQSAYKLPASLHSSVFSLRTPRTGNGRARVTGILAPTSMPTCITMPSHTVSLIRERERERESWRQSLVRTQSMHSTGSRP